MNDILKIIFSLSISGSILILFLFLARFFIKNQISKQFQYYIWLIVIARLLLPLTPKISITGTIFQRIEQVIQMVDVQDKSSILSEVSEDKSMDFVPVSPNESAKNNRSLQDVLSGSIIMFIEIAWFGVALLLLVRKMTVYQGFVKYIKAGCHEVSDIKLLDRLSQIEERLKIKRSIELYTNSLISSPLLLGFFRPCIIMPTTDLTETDFTYIIQHELIHYKRRDILYKWLVQITICLHWFNPLVWLMGREINRACELACDEAVIRLLNSSDRRDYGNMLLHAMESGGNYHQENTPASVTLNKSAKLLKERLDAIMRFKKSSKQTIMLSFILAGALTVGAVSAGAYPGSKSLSPTSQTKTTNTTNTSYANQAKQYYEAGSLPLFQIVFPRLSEKEQSAWLNKIYEDGDVSFFSVAVRGLDTNSSLLTVFAEKAYIDEEIAFFSTLTDCMDKTKLEYWLDRALKDENWAFQSTLFDKLNRDDEFDKLEENREKEWDKAQMAEYQAVGVTKSGKNYYYQGKLVSIFLDIRPNKSFYTLDINPAPTGNVNIKIIRDQNDKITGVAYMTDTEVNKLLNDLSDSNPDEEQDSKMEEKSDDLEKASEEQQLNEYQTVGVTKEGKNYYYQGKLVNIFLDIRPDQSFNMLGTNPAGTINIKITRDQNNKITGVTSMTEAEAIKLLSDMGDLNSDEENSWDGDWENLEEPWDDSEAISIPVDIAKIADGEYIWLGTHHLSEGDRVYYNVSAESGKRLDVGFAKPGQTKPDTRYNMVSYRGTDGKPEVKTGAMVWKNPAKSGEYRLFVHTEGGALANVKGSVTIIKSVKK